jgi:hypothetical protein
VARIPASHNGYEMRSANRLAPLAILVKAPISIPVSYNGYRMRRSLTARERVVVEGDWEAIELYARTGRIREPTRLPRHHAANAYPFEWLQDPHASAT